MTNIITFCVLYVCPNRSRAISKKISNEERRFQYIGVTVICNLWLYFVTQKYNKVKIIIFDKPPVEDADCFDVGKQYWLKQTMLLHILVCFLHSS